MCIVDFINEPGDFSVQVPSATFESSGIMIGRLDSSEHRFVCKTSHNDELLDTSSSCII